MQPVIKWMWRICGLNFRDTCSRAFCFLQPYKKSFEPACSWGVAYVRSPQQPLGTASSIFCVELGRGLEVIHHHKKSSLTSCCHCHYCSHAVHVVSCVRNHSCLTWSHCRCNSWKPWACILDFMGEDKMLWKFRHATAIRSSWYCTDCVLRQAELYLVVRATCFSSKLVSGPWMAQSWRMKWCWSMSNNDQA